MHLFHGTVQCVGRHVDAQQLRPGQPQADAQHQRSSKGQPHDLPHGTADAPKLAGTHILAYERGTGRCQADGSGLQHREQLACRTYTGGKVHTVLVDAGLHVGAAACDHKALGHHGQAEPCVFSEQRQVKPQFFTPQVEHRVAVQLPQTDHCREHLADRGSHSSTDGAHTETSYQQHIQPKIDPCRDQDGVKGGQAVTHRTQQGRKDIVDQQEHRAQKDDPQIFSRFVQDGLRRILQP